MRTYFAGLAEHSTWPYSAGRRRPCHHHDWSDSGQHHQRYGGRRFYSSPHRTSRSVCGVWALATTRSCKSRSSSSKFWKGTSMAKRMILMLAVTLASLGVLGFVKFRQIQEAMAQNAAFTAPPEAVTTIVAKSETWPATLNVIGTAAAVQGVTVSADLPGIVSRIAFESGASVQEGDVLVQLDTKQERAQLAAVEATRDLARLNFERLQSLVDEGAIRRAENDLAA